MRCNKTNEFSGRYYFCFLPESRKMLLITRHEVIRTSSVSTFQEHVVIGVARDFQETCRSHSVTVVLDELQQLLSEALANPQFRAGKHFAVFLQDGPGDIQAGPPGEDQHEDRSVAPGRRCGTKKQTDQTECTRQ